jgi:hypothetical protein
MALPSEHCYYLVAKMTNEYELIIKPKKGLLSIDIHEMLEYKELLFFLALRQIQIRYKQTLMGASWAMLQPFFTMIVFTLIFGGLAKMPSEGIPYPLFSYSGLLLWTYFANSVGQSGNSYLLSGLGGLLYCNDYISIHDGLLPVHAEYKHYYSAFGCVCDVHTGVWYGLLAIIYLCKIPRYSIHTAFLYLFAYVYHTGNLSAKYGW